MRGYFVVHMCVLFFFFFFQAEDGIRDVAVTGVQTCALPIFRCSSSVFSSSSASSATFFLLGLQLIQEGVEALEAAFPKPRSEERRVGKECRSRWSPYH